MTRTHPPGRRRLLLLFCALLLFGAVFTVSARAANKVTVSTTKCSYYYEVFNAAYQWALVETPQHAINETGQVAYCLQQSLQSPFNSSYHYLDGKTAYDQTTLNGLRAILEHGYPSSNGGFADDQARYATANAIRFWLAERGAPGMPSWLNYSINAYRFRSVPGYEGIFDWTISLLNKARNQECANHSISLSAKDLTLTQSGDYFVGSVTVSHSGLNRGYTLDSSQFPADSVTGYTGSNGDTLQFKIPVSYTNQSFTLRVTGKDTRTEAAIFYYEPDKSGEQRVIAYSPDISGDVATDSMTVRTPDRPLQTVTIHKQDAITGAPLAGAHFRLVDTNNNSYGEGETDAAGNLVIGNIPAGIYIAVELTAPHGYIIDRQNTEVTVTNDTQNVKVTVPNSPITGTLTILKENAKTGAMLAGAGFRVYDAGGNQLAEGYTGNDGRLEFSGLPLGDLSYAEFDAPDGFVPDSTKHPFTLTVDNHVATVSVKNNPIEGSLTIIKLDSSTEQPLSGAGFHLYTGDGTLWASGSTDENGMLVFSALPLGEYTYEEYAPPEGYRADMSRKPFSITETNTEVLVTVRNDLTPGSVSVHKVNASGQAVEGVSFLLESSTDNGDWVIVQAKNTDSAGMATFTDLNAAANIQYRLTETKTVPGQSLQEKSIHIGTLREKRDQTFTVCNTGVTALPFTGSSGFLFVPFAVLTFAVGLFFTIRRRKPHEKP